MSRLYITKLFLTQCCHWKYSQRSSAPIVGSQRSNTRTSGRDPTKLHYILKAIHITYMYKHMQKSIFRLLHHWLQKGWRLCVAARGHTWLSKSQKEIEHWDETGYHDSPHPAMPRPLIMVVWLSVPTRLSGYSMPSAWNTTRPRYSRFTCHSTQKYSDGTCTVGSTVAVQQYRDAACTWSDG